MSVVPRVTIVRHGEAVVNTVRGTAAADCKGLTSRGRGQAEYTALHLARAAGEEGGYDFLYVSPRRRCVESAEPIAKALNLDVVFAPLLRSLDHGPGDPWDPESNAIGTIPPLAPDAAPLPGAECWASYRARAGGFLADLPALVDRLCERAEAQGVVVHRAASADDACRVVTELAGGRRVVKSKSMATEEIGLDAALEATGAHVVETDLGEWIIQLAGQTPSHIIAPAVHHDRHSILEVFERVAGAHGVAPDPAALNAFCNALCCALENGETPSGEPTPYGDCGPVLNGELGAPGSTAGPLRPYGTPIGCDGSYPEDVGIG